MNITECTEHAVRLKQDGLNCAQSVAVALAKETPLSEEQLKCAAAGFGLGMGKMEGSCGALAAAVIVAGLKTDGNGTVPIAKQMTTRFEELCGGSIICKEIKGVETGKVLCPCIDCIKNAVRVYGETVCT